MPIDFKHLILRIGLVFSLSLPHLSQALPVSIPDANLAGAIQEHIGDAITTQTLLNLTSLDASDRQLVQ